MLKDSYSKLQELLDLEPESKRFNLNKQSLKQTRKILNDNVSIIKQKQIIINNYFNENKFYHHLKKELNYIKIYSNNNMDNIDKIIMENEIISKEIVEISHNLILDTTRITTLLLDKDFTKGANELKIIFNKTKQLLNKKNTLKQISSKLKHNIYNDLNIKINSFKYNSILLYIFPNKVQKFNFYTE